MMQKNKVLILGVTGMAGHILYDYLKCENHNIEVIGLSRGFIEGYSDYLLDINSQDNLKELIIKAKPTVVVNCIGSLIKKSTSNRSNALYVNGYLPIFLSELAVEFNFNLIHLSTDCVFDGLRGGYSEIDIPTPSDWYGLTKSIGERVDFSHTCVIRTSIIGPEIRNKNYREGLFDWFMNQRDRVNGYDNVFWSGVTTLELAKFISSIIDSIPKGLIHLTNGVKISKFDLLKLMNEEFNRQLTILKFSVVAHDKSLTKSKNINYSVASYNEQLNSLRNYIRLSKDKYDYSL
jgi:dTDP-4-dehydrorhamnose reductase